MHISLDARDEVLCIMNESSDLKRQICGVVTTRPAASPAESVLLLPHAIAWLSKRCQLSQLLLTTLV